MSGGYLGKFSYRTHQEFWLEAADIHIDTNDFDGTTRAHFEATFLDAHPKDQASAIRLVLGEYLVGDLDAPATRTVELRDSIEGWVLRLESSGVVVDARLAQNSSESVRLALADADKSVQEGEPLKAVDRLHTALHGYLKSVCSDAGIELKDRASLTDAFKALRSDHRAFKVAEHEKEVKRVIQGMATIVDSLNTLRNRATVAHPNEQLLEKSEAMLAVNAMRTLLEYVHSKNQST